MKLLPSTIRGQVVMAFSACFVFMAVMIVVNYDNFRRLSGAMQFFQLAAELNSTILEMRRYEKNFFLFQQDFNFEENLTYSNRLNLLLSREKDNLLSAIGGDNYERFQKNAREYASLMEELHRTAQTAGCCHDLQAKIRGRGQNLILLADQLLNTEQREINNRLQVMIPLPWINLAILVILLAFVVFFLGEKIVRPLARITRDSEAVAMGAFHRITPIGDRKNEIHHLISAINRMMDELESRQAQLIQSRKIAAVGTLTSGIAHEINNPINNMSLILEALIEDAESMTPAERLKLYQEAMDQADRASSIVKNLLEFSRANHPKVEFINLEELVDKTARLINNELHLRQAKLHKIVRDVLPPVRLDRNGLQQVLINLLFNAAQAMPDGGVIKVELGWAVPHQEVRIDVEDAGVGIPAEYMDRIFDPFFTTKKEGEGTGLGLSVSYNIIKKHGGRIEVQSQPGQGTHFSIFLPTGDQFSDQGA
ncbi:MAG: HAMP domain-containing protein [Deltaproteobacteria bacterium]|nr:HAMP domain-containing protein [Deltaproteobacteria bacterium]